MELTHAGRILFRYARRIFEAADEAEQAMREAATVARGELRVATTKIYARYLMPSVLSSFRERHPEVTVVLNEGSSEQVIEEVLHRRHQIGIGGRMGYPAGVRAEHFRDVNFVLVCGPGHPFAGRQDVTWLELEGQPLILREQGSGTARAVRDRLAKEGVHAKVAMASGSLDFILGFVAEGRGISFVYEPDAREEIAAGRLVTVPLPGPPVTLVTDIITLDEGPVPPAIRAFLRVMHESATFAWEQRQEPGAGADDSGTPGRSSGTSAPAARSGKRSSACPGSSAYPDSWPSSTISPPGDSPSVSNGGT